MGEEIREHGQGFDQKQDFIDDHGLTPQISSNLSHLTLSEEIMDFLKGDPITRPLAPLADQLCSTNCLDARGVALHKAMVDSLILRRKIYSDEDDEQGHAQFATARAYLHQLIDGCLDGYRGRLATESRSKRTYSVESNDQNKRRWGL